MIAELDGERYKGSDFIWAAFARAAREDPDALSFDRMAKQDDLFAKICRADDGTCPVPDLATHQALHMAHATSMLQQFPGGYTAPRACHQLSQPRLDAAECPLRSSWVLV